MSLRLERVYSIEEASLLNALQLAYLGDSVWETVIRDTLLHKKLNVHHLHSTCVQYVSARAQAAIAENILLQMSEAETEIYRRGRNAHAHHPAPKNQNPEDYAAATGFEAVIGYLYITGQEERIVQFARSIFGGNANG